MIYALSAITLSAFFGTAWGLTLHALAVNQQKMIMDPSCMSITCGKHAPLECIPPLELKQDPKTCCPICHGPPTALEKKLGFAPGDNMNKQDLHSMAPGNCKGAKCFTPHCFGKQKVVYRKGMCCESCSKGATLGPDEILSEGGHEAAKKILVKGHLSDVKGKVADMKAHGQLDHLHVSNEAHSINVEGDIEEEKHHFESGVKSAASIKSENDEGVLEKGPSKEGTKAMSSKSKYNAKYSSKSKSSSSSKNSKTSSSKSKSSGTMSKEDFYNQNPTER